MFSVAVVIASVLSYLMGSINFAVLFARWAGISDPRTFGSGNPGATNMLRSGRKWIALATLLGDMLKGCVAILLVARLNHASWHLGGAELRQLLAISALASFAGHVWPVFLDFKGGKGVATFLGTLAGLNISLFVVAGLTWLIMAKVSRYSSLSSITMSVVAPVAYGFTYGWGLDFRMIVLMSVILIMRHRSNIQKLIQGREGRIGQKAKA